MNNRQFIDTLARRTGYTAADTQAAVDAVTAAVARRLTDGLDVVVPGLGRLWVKKRMERISYTPSTGEHCLVPPKLVVAFKAAGQALPTSTALPALAKALREARGIKAADAQRFTATLFEVAGEGLGNDGRVKIHGLGTFKTITIRGGATRDPDTGETRAYGEREKVSFVPSDSLRDLVNRPFAQFETVVIGDRVDFSEIDDTDTPQEEPEDEEAMPLQQQETEQETEQELTISQPENTVTTMPEETIPAVGEEPAVEEKPTVKEEPAVEEKPAEDTTVSRQWEEARYKAENDTLTQANDILHEQLDFSRKMIRMLVGALVVCLLTFCVGTFYIIHLLAARDTKISRLEAQMGLTEQVITVKRHVAKCHAAAPKTSAPAPKAETPAAATEAQPQDEYNKDIRVRTGGYRITGIDRTISVEAGQTLASISSRYLGPGMECYVEAVNGGIKEVRPGQTLRIPKLQIKHKK